jgi:hypothetical protein
MPLNESGITMSRAFARRFLTGIDSVAPIAPRRSERENSRDRWTRIVETLLGWLREPTQLEDVGIYAPTGTILRLALDLAESLRNRGWEPPETVAPDPNGGIVFERRKQEVSEVIHVWEDGSVEYLLFEGTRGIARKAFAIE